MFRFLFFIFFFSGSIKAQLSGTLTIPGNFNSLAAAISTLNAQGVSGPLWLQIAGTHTEVAPAGGYSVYASGTALWPIVIGGMNALQRPLFLAPLGGNKTPGSSVQDGILRLIGCDYLTISGLEFRDPNIIAPQTMEFGIALFKTVTGDGCHHVTINNCHIALSLQNNAAGSLPACDGSRGIEMLNAITSAHTSSMLINLSSGAHHHNNFYGNLITNCNYGFSLMGFEDQSPFSFSDADNQVGGPPAVTGNTIVNFGGGGANPSAGIRAQHQRSLMVQNNVLLNNNGAGANHAGTLRGIYLNSSLEASALIKSNTITLHGGGTTAALVAIENQSGSGGNTNLIEIKENVLTDFTNTGATTGLFYGILNSASSSSLIISGNKFSKLSSHCTSGNTYLIYNTGAVSGLQEYRDNDFSFDFESLLPHTGFVSMINIVGATPLTKIVIQSNRFNNIAHKRITATGNLNFINLTADSKEMVIKENLWKNIHLNHSGPQYCIYNSSSTSSVLTVASNSVTQYNRMMSGSFCFYYGNSTSSVSAVHTFSANLISNYTAGGGSSGGFVGIQDTEGNVFPYSSKMVLSNTITSIHLSGPGGITAINISDISTSPSSQIANNVLSMLKANDQVTGIVVAGPFSGASAFSLVRNVLRDFVSTGSASSITGVSLSGGANVLNVSKNKLINYQSASLTGSVNGIVITATGEYVIQNNIVAALSATNAGGQSRVNGILIHTGTQVRLFYNTVRLSSSSNATNFGSNALFASSTPSLELRNNIFINESVANGTGQTVSFRRSASSLVNYVPTSNCNIFYAGPSSSSNLLFCAPNTSCQTLSAMQTALAPRENLSFSQPPLFTSLNTLSPFFLHLSDSQSYPAESSGVNLAGIADDLDDDVRQGNPGYAGTGLAPDLGADEAESYTLPCSSATTPTINGVSEYCVGQIANFYSSGPPAGTGINYQWKFSSSASGPFQNLPGATTSEYSISLNSVGVFFITLEETCSNTSVTTSSGIFSVTVNAQPTLTLPQVALLCSGGSYSLNSVSNANTYYWQGPAAYTSTNSIAVLQQLQSSSGGVYTLMVSANGCTTSGTMTVSVSEVNLALEASPSVICSGGTSTLSAIGNATLYLWNGIPNSGSLTVSPALTSVYTVQAIGLGLCSATKTIQIAVVSPTISARNGTICAPANTATVGVDTFTPSQVYWYATPQSVFPIASGTSINVSNTTLATYAKSFLLEPQAFNAISNSPTPTSSFVWDVLPATNLVMRDFDLAFTSTAACVVSLYYRNGTFQGFAGNQSAWSLLASTIVNPLGIGLLSPCNFSISQFCPINQVNSFYLAVSGNSFSVSSASLAALANADLSLSNGLVGQVFNPGSNYYGFEGRIKYSVEICSSPMATVNVLSGVAPVLSLTPSSLTLCPAAQATIHASGANMYSWSTGSSNPVLSITGSQNQTVVVTGTSTLGCSATASLAVYVRTIQSPSLSASANLVCPHQAVQLFASGAMSYTWSHGPNSPSVQVAVSAPSFFQVFGTDANGCLIQNTIAVSTRSVPTISITGLPTKVCATETLTLTANGAMSYTWIPSGQLTSTLMLAPTGPTLINAIGRSVNTCTNIGYLVVYPEQCLDLPDRSNSRADAIQWTQENGTIEIKCPVFCERIALQDFWGRTVYADSEGGWKYVLRMQDFSWGLYRVILFSPDGNFTTLIYWH